MTQEINEPTSYTEALLSAQASEWKKAIGKELETLNSKGTWSIIPRPSGIKPIGNKWTFKIKRDENGRITKFKARLVAKGFTQKFGIDYLETFSPVIKFTTLRILFCIAAHKDYEMHQIDITGAFLNGKLNEDIYMDVPEGVPHQQSEVCRLHKTLYGLKQSSREWNKEFVDGILKLGLIQSKYDPCLFTLKNSEGVLYITVYVDDIVLISNNNHLISWFKSSINKKFEMTDQNELHWLLGMKIERNRSKKTISISQISHIQEILKRWGLSDCNPCSLPISPGIQMHKDQDHKLDSNSDYRSIVGSLLYLSTTSRPDISTAVSIASRYLEKPASSHLKLVKGILRYLRGTIGTSITYSGEGELTLECYADASYASDQDDRKSTSGYLFLLGGAPISWLSKKQTTVALSTLEAEYIALCLATQEALWLTQLLKELDISIPLPLRIFEDNQGAIAISNDPKHHPKTKHIEVKYHFIREKVDSGEIRIQHVESRNMLADLLTKPISKEKLSEHLKRIHLTDSRRSVEIEPEEDIHSKEKRYAIPPGNITTSQISTKSEEISQPDNLTKAI